MTGLFPADGATRFVLDANIFIEAALRYYAFDLRTPFWDHLAKHGAAGRVCTIDRVAEEIRHPAELHAWMHGDFKRCVESSETQATVDFYANLMGWAQDRDHTSAAQAEFARVADAWLVAYAKATNAVVVTHEKYDKACRKRVLIPNACRFLKVPCMDTFAMLRALGIKFGP